MHLCLLYVYLFHPHTLCWPCTVLHVPLVDDWLYLVVCALVGPVIIIISDLCRRCRQFPETIEHIVVGCPAQTIYLERHNAVASAVHWCLCGNCDFPCSTDWCKHQTEPVLENARYKLLYDFNIFADRRISQI